MRGKEMREIKFRAWDLKNWKHLRKYRIYKRRIKMILKCNCKNKFQDEKYGKGMRVHNKMKEETKKYRCTVCSNEKFNTSKKEK